MKRDWLANVIWLKRMALLSVLLLFLVIQALSQERVVSGTVTSAEDGLPIPGLSVVVQGTTIGTSTDIDGRYSLTVPASAEMLVFSFVGMKTREISITADVIDVVMEVAPREMEEVVVTALGIRKEKKALGYAVQEIAGDKLSEVKDPNLVTTLSGKVAGLQVTQASSGAGGSTRILLRGASSLTGENQPIVVVDGVPIDNTPYGNVSDSEAQWDREDFGSGISDINPDDIERVDVLKGANAAALYGSRAANGAIVITTKKGKKGKGLGISFSSNITFERPAVLPKYQNVYGQGSNGTYPADMDALLSTYGSWGPKMDGSSKLHWTGEQRPYSAQKDNVKDFFETGHTSVNTIAFTAGSETGTFRFSYTNTDNKGIIPNGTLGKHNFNLRGTYDFGEYIHLDAKMTYFLQKAKNRPFLGDNSDNPVQTVYGLPRNIDINDLKEFKNADGTLRSYNSSIQNPYWSQYYNENEDQRRRFSGFAKVSFDITEDLTAFVRAGTDQTNLQFYRLYPMFYIHNAGGSTSRKNSFVTENNYDFLISYDKEIFEDYDIGLNFGGNIRSRKSEDLESLANDFIIPFVYSMDNVPVEKNEGNYEFEKKEVHSLYGTAEFVYNDMVYFDASFRNDWSSTLPKGNWSYFYPAFNLSFIFSELMEVNNILSFGKIRAGWARVGNDTGFNRLLDSYKFTGLYNNIPRVNIDNVKLNPNLKPEETTSFEIGADLNFWNNRARLNFTYYDSETTDQITNLPLAATTGYQSEWVNVGTITNKGVEIVVGGTPVKTKDFEWDVDFNFAKNENELKELTEDVKIFQFVSIQAGGGVSVQADVDGGFGDIVGKDYKRNEQGQIVVDANGLPIAGDLTVLGNYQPDWTGGLTNTLRYKDLTLRFLIDMRIGGELYSWTDANLTSLGLSKNTLVGREDGILVEGVTEDGQPNTKRVEASDIGLYYNRITGIASEFIYDATNIRFRELSLSYKLPKKWLPESVIQGATVGFIARNLFFIYRDADNFDPESSFSTGNGQGLIFNTLPTTRSIGFNVNVTF